MQCSFEEKTVHSDESFTHRTCVNEAEIFTGEDYGLCYKCAYEKLRKEREMINENYIEEEK